MTRERFEEVVSIDDAMNIFQMTNKEAYDYMLQFVINDGGEYLPTEEARKLFKTVPRKDFPNYVKDFIDKIGKAYVNPTNGAELGEPL